MARILVEVKDPLGLNTGENNKLPLLIGEYVRLEIEGRQLQNVYSIPRTALRDDASLWVVSKDNKLDIRKADVIWRDTQTVLLREGLEPGERLIVSDLASPIQGMSVQVSE